MPTLTMFLIRLPVWPFHSPPRTRSQKAAILSRTSWTAGTTFLPSTVIVSPSGARRATCNTARFSVTLIFSPLNIALIRPPRSQSCASWSRSWSVWSVTRFFE